MFQGCKMLPGPISLLWEQTSCEDPGAYLQIKEHVLVLGSLNQVLQGCEIHLSSDALHAGRC